MSKTVVQILLEIAKTIESMDKAQRDAWLRDVLEYMRDTE